MGKGTTAIPLTTVANQLPFMTVRLNVVTAKGKGGGTAFFFALRRGAQAATFLVTNRHVVEGATNGTFEVHLAHPSTPKTPAGETAPVILDNFEKRWIPHPSGVDLCAMPFGPIDADLRAQGKRPFVVQSENDHVPPEGALERLSAIEEILMVGYPFGLSDSVNNLPLIRRGITATHPAIDHLGRAQGVIDCACFPGSSGSPIWIYDNGPHFGSDGNLVVGLTRTILLGVLWGGPQITREGRIEVREVPTAEPTVLTREHAIHLGYYIKAKELITLAEYAMKVLGVSFTDPPAPTPAAQA